MGRPESRQRVHAGDDRPGRRPTGCAATSPAFVRRSSRSSRATCTSAKYGVFEERTLADLDVPDDGAFELWISPDAHDGNWMTTHPDARYLLVRQYLCDWEHDRAATLTIERVDTRRRSRARTDRGGPGGRARTRRDWVEHSVDYWCTYVERARASLPRNAHGAARHAQGRRAEHRVRRGLVGPRTARGARAHHRAPRRRLLGLDRAPPLSASTRATSRAGQTSLNMAQAFVDDDGSVRIVVARDRPGRAELDRHRGPARGHARVPVDRHADSRPVPDAVVVAGRRRARSTCRPRIRSVDPARAPGPARAPPRAPCWRATSDRWPGRRSRVRSGSRSSTRSVASSVRRAALVRARRGVAARRGARAHGTRRLRRRRSGEPWREGLRVFLARARRRGRPQPARPHHGAQRHRALAGQPACRCTRRSTQHPEILEQARRRRPCSSSAPAVRARRSCTSCSRRTRGTASRARGSCCTRARRPSARPTRPIPRIAAADQEYRFWHLIAPEYRTMHENGGDVPNEDPLIDMLEFASDHLMGSYPVPSYARWLARTDPAPVFRAHRRFLQLLQWRCRRRPLGAEVAVVPREAARVLRRVSRRVRRVDPPRPARRCCRRS